MKTTLLSVASTHRYIAPLPTVRSLTNKLTTSIDDLEVGPAAGAARLAEHVAVCSQHAPPLAVALVHGFLSRVRLQASW